MSTTQVSQSDSSAEARAFKTPLLEMRGIEKSFPGVRALKGIDLTLMRGEVLALMGENGAGKSTLIKVLGGAHQPDHGTILINGQPQAIHHPADAAHAGIGMIYQEFNLIPALSAWENIFLGREKTTAGFIHRGHERKRAIELFKRIGVNVPVDQPTGKLAIAQQQIVEIAKALSQNVKILVMDEPSATLTPGEVAHLFDIMRDLAAQGIGIIYISHRLDEIDEIADRVTVLRDGEHAGTSPNDELDRSQLIQWMVGRKIESEFPAKDRKTHPIGDTRLEIKRFRREKAVQDVSLDIRRGEILGLTGLVGAGRTELARLIAGVDKKEHGDMLLDGQPLQVRGPRDAISQGICLLTEDRKSEGLVLNQSCRDNYSLPNFHLGPDGLSRLGFVRQGEERRSFAGYIDSMKIKVPHQRQLAKHLSGGNQQKVVLAKWLKRNGEVLIFDEPTRGIDVGAKYEIYTLMNELAYAGKAILMISSELPEVLGMSDRILVMHEGKLTGEIADVKNATQTDIMQLAIA